MLLHKAVELEHQASDFGFRWETPHQIMAQIQDECVEINEHLTQTTSETETSTLQEEIGDLFHAVISLCVFCDFSPEETLALALNKFERRLNGVKAIAEEKGLIDLKGYAFDELMAVWREAKRRMG